MLKAIALGQGLAALNSLTGVFSSALVKRGVSLPATQSLSNYICLALVYGSCLIVRKQHIKEAWWKYAFLSLSECMATFSIVTAFRYTSLTSVTLLDCFTIPCVLFLSQLALKARYKPRHWLGAATCTLGLAVLVFTDQSYAAESAHSSPFLGDCLVLLGAVLYAVTNVAQEKLLGDVGKLEVLALGGAFGTLFGGILALLLERKKITETEWSAEVIGFTIAFDAACFAFASLVPFALIWGGATLLNLSLLSSDLWAALARIAFFEGFSASAAVFFMMAFALVVAGLVLYSSAGDVYKDKLDFLKLDDQSEQEGLDVANDVEGGDSRHKRLESQELLDSSEFRKRSLDDVAVGYPDAFHARSPTDST